MQRIRVLVVDDHRIFAESLAAALAAEQDVEVTAAGSAPAALRCLERAAADGRRFDVILVDADLAAPVAASPGADGAAGAGSSGAGLPGAGLPGAGLPSAGPSRVNSSGGGPSGPGSHGARGSAAAAAINGGNGQLTSVVEREAAPEGGRGAAGTGTAGTGAAGGGTAGTGAARPGGLPLVARVRGEHPSVRTVVLAERDDPRHAAAALQAGAGGWIAKDCSLSRLLQVIRGVLKDETHLSPALLTGVLKELTASRKHRTESEQLVASLTPREREVLRCMVAGLGRKAVAERLYLSPHTVRTHMQNVLGKLGVHSTLAAVALARRAGVGPVDLQAGSSR